MDDSVTVEYRGVLGTLAVGSAFVVESCDAGLLRLRVAPLPAAAREPTIAKVPIAVPILTVEESSDAS